MGNSCSDLTGWEASIQFYLGNLQADMELVLQNVESLSRRFLQFIEMAQKVKNEGVQAIRFLTIADELVTHGNEEMIHRTEHLLYDLITWGVSVNVFHPSLLVDAADLTKEGEPIQDPLHGFTVDPTLTSSTSRLMEFLERNREVVLGQLQKGPVSFSEMVALTGFTLLDGESPLNFFGIYSSPRLLFSEDQNIVIGLTDSTARFALSDCQVTGSDPIMFLDQKS